MDTIKYITQNDLDLKWGLTISSVGFQRIAPGETYPPQKHNREYMFDPANGRVLFEYQLLYIAEGGVYSFPNPAAGTRSPQAICSSCSRGRSIPTVLTPTQDGASTGSAS